MDSTDRASVTEEELGICRDILGHLIEVPTRQDTFEGIASWWLLERIMRQKTEVLRRATRHLVDLGYLEGRRRLDGRVHYRVATSRLTEIRAFLGGDAGLEAH